MYLIGAILMFRKLCWCLQPLSQILISLACRQKAQRESRVARAVVKPISKSGLVSSDKL